MRLTLRLLAFVLKKNPQRPTDRVWLSWVKVVLKTTFQAAERMASFGVFPADYIIRKLIVWDEFWSGHGKRLALWGAA